MGESKNRLRKIKKMKVSAILVAAAQAAPAGGVHQWMVDNWWATAVETFNFASTNWEKFSAAVDGVDQSMFPPLFDWCNSNGDSEVSSEELINCSKKGADYFDMPDDYQMYIYKFAQKYWHLVDQDNSGSLNFDEYKYTMAGSLQSTQVLSSRLSMLTPMVFSIMAKSMHGMRPPIRCSPNGTGLHLTNSLPVQDRHGRILKWTVMRPLGPKQNLPNSV